MPVRTNAGGGVSARKDTATEADVRYPKTFHSGSGVKARVGEILDCVIKKITPGKNAQTIPKGSYIAEDIQVEGDANLISKNIRGGVSIFDVPGDQNVVDTSDGNLAASGMLAGQRGYSKGKPVNGDIATLNDGSFSPSDASAYNDCKIVGAASNSYVGAFDYSVVGYIAGKIRIHIANLLSGNIRSGVKVGGAGGYIEGTFTGNATAATGDIVKNKTAGIKGEMVAGTLVDNSETTKSATPTLDTTNSRLQMTIPATAKYSTDSKLYATYSAIRTLIGLTGDKLWYNVTILGQKSSRSGLEKKTWTPGTSDQTIAAGTCLTGAQTIEGDPNLAAANILYSKKIFGVSGSVRKYAEKHGKVTSSASFEISAGDGDAKRFAKITLDLGFTPLVGFLCYYTNGNRDITVFSTTNGTSKYGTVMNFNQAKRYSYNSAAWNNGEEGVVCSGTKLTIPVAYQNVAYDYWFAGYY